MTYHFDYSLVFSPFYFGRLVDGIETTVILFFVSLAIGFFLALVLTGARLLPLRPLQYLVAVFIEFQRNVPLLVHLLLWYFGIASILPKAVGRFADHLGGAEFLYAAITLSLYGAAFMSEDMRGGLRAIPQTQFENARAMGFSFFQMVRLVILPQAVRYALPPLISQSLWLYKNTSIAAAIGVAELMYRSREIATQTFRVFEAFSVATVIYVTGSLVVLVAGYGLGRWLSIPGIGSQKQ